MRYGNGNFTLKESVMRKSLIMALMIFGLVCMGFQISSAAPIAGVWNDWTQFANDDGSVSPGVGGQFFDAEYLYYKYDYDDTNPMLSIGLQAGFDLDDGEQAFNSYSP